MMKIGIMGAGGMGCYLGGRLAHDGHDVRFISRGKQLQALRQDGLKVESHYGDFHLPSVKATDDCCEVGPVDLVLFCVKSYDTAAAAGQMKPRPSRHRHFSGAGRSSPKSVESDSTGREIN